jgi:hypothetical protein
MLMYLLKVIMGAFCDLCLLSRFPGNLALCGATLKLRTDEWRKVDKKIVCQILAYESDIIHPKSSTKVGF